MVETITENDTSASGRKARRGFRTVLRHLREGTTYVVIAERETA